MSNCSDCNVDIPNEYSRILWIALVVNLFMFFVELVTSWFAGSIAVFGDAMDFLGDAGNYGSSLIALRYSKRWRSRVALGKGIVMGVYGILIVCLASIGSFSTRLPNGVLMVIIAVLALFANAGVALLLYRYRGGDSNMRSVWLCSRNDAIVNGMVLLAGIIILITEQSWPDIVVALLIGVLGLKAAYSIIRQAHHELINKDH